MIALLFAVEEKVRVLFFALNVIRWICVNDAVKYVKIQLKM